MSASDAFFAGIGREIRLVITDLDNTLYDWVSFFVPAFYAMVFRAAEEFGVDPEALLDEIREVHRKHGSSEHPYALLETPSVRRAVAELPSVQSRAKVAAALLEFDRVRDDLLQLYPEVIDSLQALRAIGVAVVAHTDARIPNTLSRIRRLGLGSYLDRIYAPSTNEPILASSELEQWSASRRLVTLETWERKPNPQVVHRICNEAGVTPSQAIYVGDSITRDMFMAKQAGVLSAWAKYGTNYDQNLWAKLVRVSHWTEDDVAREAYYGARAADVVPDFALRSFGDVLRIAIGVRA